VHPKSLSQVSSMSVHHTYLYTYYSTILSKFACATSNHSNKHLFCVPVPLIKRQGVVSVFHDKWVTLTMGVYSLVIARERLVIGMPSPMIKMKNNETNSPGKLIVWRAPEDSASHGLCLNG
jgi:predicted permease